MNLHGRDFIPNLSNINNRKHRTMNEWNAMLYSRAKINSYTQGLSDTTNICMFKVSLNY